MPSPLQLSDTLTFLHWLYGDDAPGLAHHLDLR